MKANTPESLPVPNKRIRNLELSSLAPLEIVKDDQEDALVAASGATSY